MDNKIKDKDSSKDDSFIIKKSSDVEGDTLWFGDKGLIEELIEIERKIELERKVSNE